MNLRNFFTLMLLFPAVCINAQSLQYNAEEQKAWDSHKDEISEPVDFLAADVFASIQVDYEVNPYDNRKLRGYCLRMERHKYLHNFILESARERCIIKRQIESQYWDSIAQVLIPMNPTMAGRYTGYAARMGEELNLPEETRQTILMQATVNAQRLRQETCASFVSEEISFLRTCLERPTIETVMNAANQSAVSLRCEELWRALNTAGLSEDLDETVDMGRARLYYQQEMFIRDYYMGDKSLIEANLNDLYRHKPRIIKMYEGLRQRELVKQKHEEKVGGEFSW